RGAKRAGGLTVGILPTADAATASPDVDIVLTTGLGEARNAVIALSGDALVACGMSAGTASEVALALRAGKPVLLLNADSASIDFFRGISSGDLGSVAQVSEAVGWLKKRLPPTFDQ